MSSQMSSPFTPHSAFNPFSKDDLIVKWPPAPKGGGREIKALAKCKDGMFEHLTLTLDSDGSDILQAAMDKVAAIDKQKAAAVAK